MAFRRYLMLEPDHVEVPQIPFKTAMWCRSTSPTCVPSGRALRVSERSRRKYDEAAQKLAAVVDDEAVMTFRKTREERSDVY